MLVLNRLRAVALTLVLLGFVTGGALAEPRVSLFVGKAEVSGVVRNGRVYVPADALLGAMGYAWSPAGDEYALTRGAGGGPAMSGRVVRLRSGQNVAAAPAFDRGGRLYVDARAVAEGLGFFYVFTPDVGVAQITTANPQLSQRSLDKAVRQARAAVKADVARAASGSEPSLRDGSGRSSEGATSTEKTKDGGTTADDEPVAVERISYSVGDFGQVRGTIVLRNDAEVSIRNMFVYVTMQAPDTATGSDLPKMSGQGGLASLPSYVKSTTDGSLPTYGGTPPSSVSSSYPEMANLSTTRAASPAPTPTPQAAPAASPEASPTPPPMHDVASLPAIFVDEIAPGKTVSVPFTWTNPQKLPQVAPTVRTQHDKVAFTRKKDKSEEEAATTDEGSTDASASTDTKIDAKAEGAPDGDKQSAPDTSESPQKGDEATKSGDAKPSDGTSKDAPPPK